MGRARETMRGAGAVILGTCELRRRMSFITQQRVLGRSGTDGPQRAGEGGWKRAGWPWRWCGSCANSITGKLENILEGMGYAMVAQRIRRIRQRD
jgi:hypothetical protein